MNQVNYQLFQCIWSILRLIRVVSTTELEKKVEKMRMNGKNETKIHRHSFPIKLFFNYSSFSLVKQNNSEQAQRNLFLFFSSIECDNNETFYLFSQSTANNWSFTIRSSHFPKMIYPFWVSFTHTHIVILSSAKWHTLSHYFLYVQSKTKRRKRERKRETIINDTQTLSRNVACKWTMSISLSSPREIQFE